MLSDPRPVEVLDRLADEGARLLLLLDSLPRTAWNRPTMCAGWSVKDLVAHLVADDLGRLSRQRDGHRLDLPSGMSLVEWVDGQNARWVEAARRLSVPVLLDLFRLGRPQVDAWFGSLDLNAIGGPVSWAGPVPAPIWLDVAREYTERWHHHQQVREAVGAPLLDAPRFLSPVLATYVRALPVAFRDLDVPDDTAVLVTISGPSGGDWAVVRHGGSWRLYAGVPDDPVATCELSEDTAWRLFTKSLSDVEARARVSIRGTRALGSPVLRAIAIIG